MNATSPVSAEEVFEVLYQYRDELVEEFNDLIGAWPVAFGEEHVKRVLSAILARQITLGIELIEDHRLWNPHLGPLILRTLLENWLKMEWLIRDPVARARGIAKADLFGVKSKLQLRLATADGEQIRKELEELVEYLSVEECIFESPDRPIMIDARDMARKAGGEALVAYRRHQVLFASCVHSSWNHIARFNLTVDPNPLHRFTFIPMWKEITPDLNFALLAAEYCDRAIRSISGNQEMNEQSSAYTELMNLLEDLGIVQTLPADDEDKADDSDVEG